MNDRPCILQDGITITTDEVRRATGGSARRCSAVNFATEFVELFQLYTKKVFSVLVREVTAKFR